MVRGMGGEHVSRHIRSDQLDPSAALRERFRHEAHIEGDQVHGDAAHERRGMRTEITDEAFLAVADG